MLDIVQAQTGVRETGQFLNTARKNMATTQQAPLSSLPTKNKAHLKHFPKIVRGSPVETSKSPSGSLHPVQGKAYSVPHPYVGKSVWVRALNAWYRSIMPRI